MKKLTDAVMTLAHFVWERCLKENTTLPYQTYYKLANDHMEAEGLWTAFDATNLWDALEAAMFLHMGMAAGKGLESPALAKAFIARSKELRELLPTQTSRTDDQLNFQQFSTPPHYAALAAYVAKLAPQDVVLEPSAGLGGMAMWALREKCRVIVNEYEPGRRELLVDLINVFNERADGTDYNRGQVLPACDANQLHISHPNLMPDVVLMNPPFSSNGATGIKDVMVGAVMMERHLSMLKPNGRLVAILPGGRGMDAVAGMHLQASTYKDFWKRVMAHYTVRCNVGVEGSEYKAMGTSFHTRLVVIDNIGTTPNQVPYQGEQAFHTVEELVDLLGTVRELRADSHTVKPKAGYNELLQRALENNRRRQEEEKLKEIADASEGRIVVATIPKPVTDEKKTETQNLAVANTESVPDHQTPRHISEQPDDSTPGVDEQAVCPADKPTYVAIANVEKEYTEEDGDIFQGYKPFLRIPYAHKHSAPLVESDTMKAVMPPIPTQVVTLPKQVVESGNLSEAQLEMVVYAAHAHGQILPNGMRRGFLIGGGTGFGKGATEAGIAVNYYMTGRARRILWLSKSPDLAVDALRDWKWLGFHEKDFFLQDSCKKEQISRDGVMFSTYKLMSMNSESADASNVKVDATGNIYDITGGNLTGKKKGMNRYLQVVNWLQEAVDKGEDVVIMMDESHMMGNAVVLDGMKGKKPAQQALIGMELLKAFPMAYVVFASATAATEVHNLAYAAERLGLCGKGTAFPSLGDFLSKIREGGMLAMEMVAKDMKAMGVYLASSLSYEGTSFELLEHKLTDDQRLMYDDACNAWQYVNKEIESALNMTGGVYNKDARKTVKGQYYGAMQRFFNQVLTSMQMPTTLTHMKQAIAEGHCVVAQLTNTNEAATDRAVASAMAAGESLDDLDITPRDTLLNLVEHCFPTAAYTTYRDDDGSTKSEMMVDEKGNPKLDPRAVKLREQVMEAVSLLRVPQGALDMIIDVFGTDAVAEITGRSARYVLDDKGNRVREVRSKVKANKEAADFMADKRQVLVFSGAGNTGRSFQADKRCANQRRRYHYVVQPGWRADEALQGLGRTHRNNQVSAPHYILPTTDLAGQKRFITSIARRIEQLGSLTKGNRKAASGGLFSAEDNLETPYSAPAIWTFFLALQEGRIEGLGLKEVCTELGLKLDTEKSAGKISRDAMPDVTKFLNRLLCMTTERQNLVFNTWFEILQGIIETARESGTLDTGVERLHAERIEKMSEQTLNIDNTTGARTRLVEVELYRKVRFVTFDEVCDGQYISASGVPNYADKVPNRFIMNLKSERVYAISVANWETTHDGRVRPSYRKIEPTSAHRISEDDLDRMEMVDLTREQARVLWEKEVKALPEYRTDTEYVVAGAMLPVWHLMPVMPTRILQVETTAGERILGRYVEPDCLGELLENFGMSMAGTYLTTAELYERIVDGWTVELAGLGKLVWSRPSGAGRVCIVSDNYQAMRSLQLKGYFKAQYTGNVQYNMVLCTPSQLEPLELLLREHPAVRIANKKSKLGIPLLREPVAREAIRTVEEKGPDFYDAGHLIELVPLADWVDEQPVVQVETPVLTEAQQALLAFELLTGHDECSVSMEARLALMPKAVAETLKANRQQKKQAAMEAAGQTSLF
jgi:predicted RNA methylase